MKADLANNWILMSLLPYGPSEEFRNTFTACLLGDELADDACFGAMSSSKGIDRPAPCKGSGCKFCFEGSCFHPFRPGSVGTAIFSSCFRGVDGLNKLSHKEDEDALDHRRCRACCSLYLPGWVYDSRFAGVARFYDRLLESEPCLLGEYDKFREWYGPNDSDGEYFGRGTCYSEFEGNIERHFEKMMNDHFCLVKEGYKADGVGDHKPSTTAIAKVRMDLVTHWMRYWSAGKYKEDK